jgi:putative FmdB family regulatory protein
MPMFEYQCRECGTRITKFQHKLIHEVECPRCSTTAEHVISAPAGFRFGKWAMSSRIQIDNDPNYIPPQERPPL